MTEKLRKIEVERHGAYGYFPKEKHLCIYNGESSCVSGSGDSQCGGNCGIEKILDKEFVLCAEKPPKK